MIQELFGGAGLIVGGENKISIHHGTILEGTPTASPAASPSPSSSTNPNSTTSSNSEGQNNLRCPRCDSSNTKFCYYNNYNLTQPRHFCKTCRRYWTKGGALRNVPIGGGCRKNRSTSVPTGKSTSAATKMKILASEIGLRPGFGNGSDHDPFFWSTTTSPQNSHILTLLRASTLNPNPVKEESGFMGHHGITESFPDPNPTQISSPGIWTTPFGKNNSNTQNGVILGEVQNNGIQELYQRLKSSSTNYYSDNSAGILGNVASSAPPSSILESAPVTAAAELGYWNVVYSSRLDLPTTNGAYP